MAQQSSSIPPQHQDRQPGREKPMRPPPASASAEYVGSGKLTDKVALITGGDSGIGRAAAIAFAKEGAHVVITYLDEQADADDTRQKIQDCGRKCIALAGDIGDPAFCQEVVRSTIADLGKLDILVNNAAEQHPQPSIARYQCRATRAHLPHQYFFDVPYGQSCAAAFAAGRAHHQYRIGHRISRQQSFTGLCSHQRGNRRIHAFAGATAGGTWHPRQCRGARPDLDAIDSVELFSGTGSGIRQECAAGASRAT